MGKQKVGKQRKDKYYQYAKEIGYRSRAAFKLIQLNREYEFLQKSRVCIDLCAAPGGWMQVAQQNMPTSSIVVGVDLFPIKPVPGCISLTEDITTEKCRAALRKELQNWKADVVLHDGAPNVGKNWLHDAYSQACLTLSAVKLATQFLRPGGWFVTKVFRSKDYNSLKWVFKQLFKEVHEKKPLASRHESAETFVVCRNYKAPDKIDPRFFDIKYVFQDLDVETQSKLNVFHPDKQKKAKALGYPENNLLLHNKVSARQFVDHENALELLEHATEIVLNDPEIASHPKTTAEIKECCSDIKVLGRKELKMLLAWWKALHNENKKPKLDEVTEKQEDEETKSNDEDDEEAELKVADEEIANLQEEEKRELKRKRKKVLKERKKLNERLNLKMIHKGDDGPQLEEDGFFDLKQVSNLQQMSGLIDQNPDIVAEEDEDDIEAVIKKKKVKFNPEIDHLDSSGLYYKDSDSEEIEEDDDDDLSDKDNNDGLNFSDEERQENDDEEIEESKVHPLITDLDNRTAEQKRLQKAQMWLSRDAFKDVLNDKDEEADLDTLVSNYKKEGLRVIGEKDDDQEVSKESSQESDDEDDSSDDSDGSEYNLETHYTKSHLDAKKKDGFEIVKPTLGKRKLTPEELALGTMLISSKKARRDITNAAWNRYAFNDVNLPAWFAEDEEKHMRKPVEVPKDYVETYKKALQEINARPIKKIVEAKSRKKRRAVKKLDKMKKRVESVIENTDISERERSKQVKQLYKKATQKKKEEIQYVVSKKQKKGGKVRSRPAGVKGRYKVVDSRMKKDVRAQKRVNARNNKGKKGGKAKRSKK